MKNKKVLEDLYDYCRWNDSDNVKNLLKKSSDPIDILDDRGIFLRLAISGNNLEMLKALVTYFEEKQFPIKNTKYEEAKTKLIEILENATDSIDLQTEMKEILSPYIDFEGSEHDTLNDSFSDIDQTAFIENFNKDTNSNNLLNEEILRKFDIETKPHNQIKTMENLLGFGDNGTHYQVEEHETTNIVLSGNLAHEVH